MSNTKTPESLTAERAFIGSILVDPRLIPIYQDTVTTAEFYHHANQIVWGRMLYLFENGKPITFETLVQSLTDNEELGRAGGPANISELFVTMPTALNVETYAEIVQEKAYLRRVITHSERLTAKAREEQGDVEGVRNEVGKTLLNLTKADDAKRKKPIAQLVKEFQDECDAGEQSKLIGIKTGFWNLDRYAKLIPGDMWTIAARSSEGKTTFALNILNHVCINDRQPSAMFSLEMPERMIVAKLVSMRAGVSVKRIVNKLATPDELDRWRKALNEVGRAPLHIWGKEHAGMHIKQAHAHMRLLKAQDGELRLGVFDYDEKFKGDRPKGGSKEEELSFISNATNEMAGELGVTNILISQLTKDKKTGEVSLRYSEAKMNDASVVILLDNQVEPGQVDGPVVAKIEKGRFEGRGMECTMWLKGATGKFKPHEEPAS